MTGLEVLALVFGIAAYVGLVEKANNSGVPPGCMDYKFYDVVQLPRRFVPWPLRQEGVTPREGAVDRCSGRRYNGQWWYTP